MKPLTSMLVLVLVVVTATSAFGGKNNDELVFKGTPVSLIERNLAIALKTPIPGIQASASQTARELMRLVPEYEFGSLVIPLMAIVKDEGSESSVRMLAALALHEIHSARGDFAIQRTPRFTSSSRMAHLCSWLAVERMKKDAPAPQETAMR